MSRSNSQRRDEKDPENSALSHKTAFSARDFAVNRVSVPSGLHIANIPPDFAIFSPSPSRID
jgi:hypothetical protein